MSTMRMNRLPKSDGYPVTGNRSMFDYVTKGSAANHALTLPKLPQPPVHSSESVSGSDDKMAASDLEEATDEGAAKRQRKTYNGEFKRNALQLAVTLGVNNAARRLKVAPGPLSGWKRQPAKA